VGTVVRRLEEDDGGLDLEDDDGLDLDLAELLGGELIADPFDRREGWVEVMYVSESSLLSSSSMLDE
jgi:hypothetical protein